MNVLTVAEVTQVVTNRVSEFARIVDMSDDEMNDAIGWAIRTLGNETASIITVSDADLLDVTAIEVDAVLGLSELRLLETILQNYIQVTRNIQDVTENFDELRTALQERVKSLRDNLQAQYGHLLAYPLTTAGADRLFSELERDTKPVVNFRNVGAF